MAVFSRGAFEALADIDDTTDLESEEEQEQEDQVTKEEKMEQQPISKAAKKRAAKAAREAELVKVNGAEVVERVQDKVNGVKPEVEKAVDGVKEKAKETVKAGQESVKAGQQSDAAATITKVAQDAAKRVNDTVTAVAGNVNTDAAAQTAANASKVVSDSAASASKVVSDTATNASKIVSESAANASKVVSETAGKANEAASQVASKATKAVSSIASKATEAASNASTKASKVANGKTPVPKSLPFKPSLPDLPVPIKDLQANRKRPTPADFTPQSPSKEVKFQDGLAPGEGKDGERIIAGVGRHPVAAVVEPKNRNAMERTVWTFIMIFGFIILLCMGHPYMILLVMLCQTLVYKEVTALFELSRSGSNAPTPAEGAEPDRWSKTLNWYFFVVTNYFLYGESIIYYFKHIVFVDAYFLPFAKNHRFIAFMLYVVGFVGFVANLKKQYLRQQFALFCWVHMSLLVIVVSSHFIINNILEGLIWFFVPASLVICNDVMAYICGKSFGRTPLIKLSPKKTVEGFVGAFICTLIFGLAWSTFFMRFNYMICPARDLGTNVFSNVQCKLNPVFVWRQHTVTGPLRAILPSTITYAPFQIHSLFMATFASLVAPFGGFFASGFKRAFNIKDFGHSIPGHGGMTDRMDCQFLMGLFSYVYYSSLIRVQNATVGSVLQTIVTALDVNEQLELLADLRRYLDGQGVKN